MRSTRAQQDSINLALLIDLDLLRNAQDKLFLQVQEKISILKTKAEAEDAAEKEEQAQQNAENAKRIDGNSPQEKSDKTSSGQERPGLKINLPIGVTWITEETEVILCKLHLLRDNQNELFLELLSDNDLNLLEKFPNAATSTSLIPLALAISGQANTNRADLSPDARYFYDPRLTANLAGVANSAAVLPSNTQQRDRSAIDNMVAWLRDPSQVTAYNPYQNYRKNDSENSHLRR